MAEKNQNLQERLVKILDAVVKEDEGTEELPVVEKTLWLVIQDVETQVVIQAVWTVQDIKERLGMSRTLQGRELYNFATILRNRVEPCKLKFDITKSEISPEEIMKESI